MNFNFDLYRIYCLPLCNSEFKLPILYTVYLMLLNCLQDEEVAMLSELSHLQEVVDQVQKLTTDPFTLPPASEQVNTKNSFKV